MFRSTQDPRDWSWFCSWSFRCQSCWWSCSSKTQKLVLLLPGLLFHSMTSVLLLRPSPCLSMIFKKSILCSLQSKNFILRSFCFVLSRLQVMNLLKWPSFLPWKKGCWWVITFLNYSSTSHCLETKASKLESFLYDDAM